MIPTLQLGQFGRSLPGAQADANALAIYNSLVAYWEFDQNDATTQFLDSHGANHLSVKRNDTGATVATSDASAANGRPGRNFLPYNGSIRPSAYIPRSNTGLDLPNGNFTFGGWFHGANNGGLGGWACFLMGRLGSAVGGTQCYLFIEGGDSKVYLRASADGTAATATPTADSFATGSQITLITGSLDRTNNLLRLRMRNSGGGSSANITVAFPSALYTGASSANFCINGAMSSDNAWFAGNRYLDGQASPVIDSCFYCTRAITDAEFDYLHNSGNGRSYAALKAAAGY